VAVVSEDAVVQANALEYFEKYVFEQAKIPAMGPIGPYDFTDWSVDVFKTRDELFKKVVSENKSPYAFALTFDEFDTVKDNYKVQFHFSKTDVPDTTLTAYNPLVRMPDLKSWNLWFKSGSVAIMPYITEFIARAKTDHGFGNPMPALYQ
jgi:hypothetical protein